MTAYLKKGFMVLMVLFLSQTPTMAVTIVDLDTSDLNTIESVAVGPQNVLVKEDYNEEFLIGYPSHDGNAIVNQRGGFFDKVLTFDRADMGTNWKFDFEVENTSPYIWSDYHFEFWNADFTDKLDVFDLISGWSSQIFTNNSWDGHSLNFWAPGWVGPGMTDVYGFTLDPDKILGQTGGAIGIRQIATTVPEPAAMAFFGLGLLSLAALGRRKT